MSGQQILVTMRDVRASEGCAWGSLRFLRRHRLDAHRFFLHGGLPVEEVEAIGDAMALRIAQEARRRASSGE